MNTYLVLAYGFLWLLFVLYAWSLARRQASLKKDLADLQARLSGQPPRN